MHLRSLRRPGGSVRTPVLEAETVLVEQYGDLVRLAHLVLPATLGRHRRVLVAHSLVQRTLPRIRSAHPVPSVPAQRAPGPARFSAVWALTAEVLRGALAYGRGARPWVARHLPRLPLVFGLRLFPRSGGAAELALAQRLSGVSAAARAAFLLGVVHGLSQDDVRALLTAAGAADPDEAVRAAAALRAGEDEQGTAAALLASQEFDACALQASPTDLLRRRRRVRVGLAVCGVAAISAVTLVTTTSGGSPGPAYTPAPAAGPALRPAALLRTPAGVWDNTARVDFTAWPVRGDRAADEALLGRALGAWAHPSSGTRVTTAAATSRAVPVTPPRLLFAGGVGARAVVLLHDGERLARYSEPLSGSAPGELTIARADDSDVTTAAAVAVDDGRGGGGVRYLLAPWVAEAGTRDLLRPDALARPLAVAKDGVTAAVPPVPSGGDCGSAPVLQLRSSERIAEHHAFLLAGVGALSPVHLTYTPLPGRGAPARQPREATGSEALLAWAHQGCALGRLGGSGVRAVNAWDFARQRLPGAGGDAVWSCARADTWRGPGSVTVTLRTSRDRVDAPGRVVARVPSTALCSRFGRHVVAATQWRAPDGRGYLLAAGSRAVTRIAVSGDVRASRSGSTLAVPAAGHPRVSVRARLATGQDLEGVGGG
ncbi:hypothetical protein ABZ439_02630 [Streptomyces sp. NPDC005840]|uniref:hypothetical protein n=1 Tax=unclassified Streptomyces TaxID=2593676 RepID=UPI0033C6F759